MPTYRERIKGGIVGLLVGDALGVPYEFNPASAIPASELIEFDPPKGFVRSHRTVPPGTWSDDGAQALCLLDSLLTLGRFDARDFAGRLLRWYDQGYMAVDGMVFDIGIATGGALQALRAGADPATAGSTDTLNNGNGSMMRVLPLALWHQGSDADLVRDAQAQSCVTHGHMRAQVCCALYCLWARRVLRGAEQPWSEAVQALRAIYVSSADAIGELEWSIRPDDLPAGRGSGYVVDSLRSAKQSADLPTYEAAVRAAISLGNDTDSTACLAGGIVGLRDGIDAIPTRWKDGLRGTELYQPLLRRLLEFTDKK